MPRSIASPICRETIFSNAECLHAQAQAVMVHFKVFGGGITLTDATRKLFFRRHYAAAAVSYAGLDPDERRFAHVDGGTKHDR